MATRYDIVRRGGRWAIVRVMPSGDAAGYDPVAAGLPLDGESVGHREIIDRATRRRAKA